MMHPTNKTVCVIGAGIAGMATAIRLQSQGFRVTIFEANNYPGGKLTEFKEEGYRFDMGPSLFTMPQFIEELFETSHQDIQKYFQYKRKDVVCNYFYEDGTTFTAPRSIQDFARNIEESFGVDQHKVISYFKNSKKKYDLTHSLFLENSLHRIDNYLSFKTIKAISRLRALNINTSLHEHNEKSFDNEKLIQLFDRFATYNGSNPYQTPGIMSMIPHLEQYYGTYFPKGGMHNITMSLFNLAKELGVKFHFNSSVSKIIVENKKAKAIEVNSEIKKFDIIISNSDVVPTYRKLLSKEKAPERTLSQERSSSALIFYWGVTQEFPELDLHNIFFSEDYKEEFNCIFHKKSVHYDPTIYINITSKEEKEDAPEGCENWFVMVNVPSNTGQNWDKIINETRRNIIEKLSRNLGVELEELINFESILDPRRIENKTQSYQGALYGAASNNKFAAFLRHPNFTQRIQNLYFCGGSVHPGGGIPLCLLSGKIVSELICKKEGIA